MSTIQIVPQYATTSGGASLFSFDSYNLLVWASVGDSSNKYTSNIMMATSPPGDWTFATVTTGPLSAIAPTGQMPAFVPLPDGQTGYVVWINNNGQVAISLATSTVPSDGGAVPTWSCGEPDTSWVTPDPYNIMAGPVAALGQQNGALVLDILWLTAGLDLCILQMEIGNEANSLGVYSSTAMSKLYGNMGAPISLVRSGGVSYLSWNDSAYLYLAMDELGGVDFDFANAVALDDFVGVAQGAVVYVPLGSTFGYAFGANDQGISRALIGRNQRGKWTVNSAGGAPGKFLSCDVSDVLTASRFTQLVDGVYQPAIGLVWTTSSGAINLTSITPTIAPMPVVQCALS